MMGRPRKTPDDGTDRGDGRDGIHNAKTPGMVAGIDSGFDWRWCSRHLVMVVMESVCNGAGYGGGLDMVFKVIVVMVVGCL